MDEPAGLLLPLLLFPEGSESSLKSSKKWEAWAWDSGSASKSTIESKVNSSPPMKGVEKSVLVVCGDGDESSKVWSDPSGAGIMEGKERISADGCCLEKRGSRERVSSAPNRLPKSKLSPSRPDSPKMMGSQVLLSCS